jgi:hypothetical protein
MLWLQSVSDKFADFHPHTALNVRRRGLTQTQQLSKMDTKPQSALFDVFLRLRPSTTEDKTRFLEVEAEIEREAATHITIKAPANDHRKRAVERFAFTRVFEESATQRDILERTGAVSLVAGVLGAEGREGRDGLLATLGVTGSGKVSKGN